MMAPKHAPTTTPAKNIMAYPPLVLLHIPIIHIQNHHPVPYGRIWPAPDLDVHIHYISDCNNHSLRNIAVSLLVNHLVVY